MLAVAALTRPALLLRPDGAGDDRGLDHQRRRVRHAVGEQRVAHELDDERADQRADDGRPAAGEQRAADRDRGDRVELHAEADQIGVARRIDRDDDQPGDSCAQAADDVDPALDRGDRNAGQTRRPLVAADREDLPAEHGAAQRPGGGGDQHQHDDDLTRHAEDAAEADELERRVLEHLQIAVGQHLRDAAPGDEQDQRGDDRLDWKRVMSQPLNKPKRPATPTGTTKASASPSAGYERPNELRKIIGASAPEIAISEPTERSMPPVAMTSVMPTADDDDRRHLGQVDVERLPAGEMRRDREIERDQHDERGKRRIAPEKRGDVERGALGADRRRVSHGLLPRQASRRHAPSPP